MYVSIIQRIVIVVMVVMVGMIIIIKKGQQQQEGKKHQEEMENNEDEGLFCLRDFLFGKWQLPADGKGIEQHRKGGGGTSE